MLEIETSLSQIYEHMTTSKASFEEGRTQLKKAQEEFIKTKKLRKEALQQKLDEKNLAICCRSHGDVESVENPTREQLGIFPQKDMRLHYLLDGPYAVQGEYHDTNKTTEKLELLCPEHYPKGQERAIRTGTYTGIRSEVLENEGVFTLSVDGTDITALVNRGGYDMYPNGMPLAIVDDAVFQHFDIPDLPKEPTRSNL